MKHRCQAPPSPPPVPLRCVRLALALWAGLLVAAAPSGAGDYLLGPGDTLAISVFEHPELSIPAVQIRPDGRISHPFIGELAVAGLTPQGLAAEVTRRLAGELNVPLVAVNVTGFRENRVYVLGQVRNPGAFPADGALTVAKAVALAGDLTEKADRRRATRVPHGGEPLPLDLEQALGGSGGPPTLLEAGDTLIVQPAHNPRVILWGEVARPGQFELPQEQSRLLSLLAAGGGLTPNANRREATLIHSDGQSEPVDLEALLEDHDPQADRVLRDGDVLTITPHRNEIMVLGAANKQGAVPYLPGDRVSNVLALCGGLSEAADPENLRLVRGRDTVLTINARAFLREQNLAANIEVRPGDTLFVPELRREAMVFGAVGRAGSYPIRDNDRLLDVLARAGGFVPGKSSPSQTALIRLEGQEAKVLLADVNELMRGRQVDKNFLVRDRDVIVVPERTGTNWRDLVGLLFQAATMVQIIE